MNMRTILSLLFITFSIFSFAQNDSVFIRKIFDEALENGRSHEDLRSLCKDIGARITGSAEAQMAVEWSERKMKSYGFDRVWLQEIQVPHWERGTTEAGWIHLENGEVIKTKLLALGGSVGTDGLLRADVVCYNSLEDLKKEKDAKKIKGKIVFINQAFDEKIISTFKAYGGCWPIRGLGAMEAANKGAVAVIIRSLASPDDDHPHTGSTHYNDSTQKIPAAAISTNDANRLAELCKKQKIQFTLEMDCRSFPDAVSYNVIGEMKGTIHPKNVITFGGHLDSWDTGEGAHDDGAGVIHCMEALRILKTVGYKPKNTLRVVFFMNEENGNRGGKHYAQWAGNESGEKHIAAVESDRGGFTPRGFECEGPEEYVALLKTFEHLLSPYELHIFRKGHGGVDISPLKEHVDGIPLFGFVPDSQRYFDFHHSEDDIFENVNKRELELGCASMASFLYLLDKNLK